MVSSASSAYVTRSFEATFGAGGTVEHSFGYDAKLSGLEWANNQAPLPQLYTPEVEDYLYGRNAGACSIEYTLANSYWLTALLNDPTVEDDTTDPTQVRRTWDSDPSVNSAIRITKFQNLEFGKALTDENVVRQAKGVITESIQIKTSIDNPVSLTETLAWGKEDAIGTTLDSTLPNNADKSPMNFVNSTVELPDATTLIKVQDLELTLNRNQKLLWALGSADACDGYPQILEMTGKVILAFENKTELQRVVDRGEVASMEVLITNGLTNAAERKISLLFGGVGLSRHGVPTVNPGDLILQEFDFQCRHLTADSVDATAIFNWD